MNKIAPKYKIALTGGAGFIGSHLADAFVAQGHEVHIIDDLSSGKLENIPTGTHFHQLDIGSEAVVQLFEQKQFEILVHQAAQMDVRRSVADPRFDARINVDGFLNLMEAGRKNGLKKVLFASTGGAIYGDPSYTPQDEMHELQPVSPYGITKLATEKYLYFYEKEYGIQHVILRYANVYGPRQNPHGEAGVVAIFTTKMLNGEQPMINGDGQQTRDYVFVGDVVQMNLHALHYDKSGIFNVGTATETNVIELFKAIRAEIGHHFPEIYRAAAAGEQRRSVVGIRKANEAFGWKPQYDLAMGIKETVNWFRETLKMEH